MMFKHAGWMIVFATLALIVACSRGQTQEVPESAATSAVLAAHVLAVLATAPAVGETVERTDEEWRELLTAEQYRILRQSGTEGAFTGTHWDHDDVGTFHCAACGAPLFSSETKFDSGTGWPSYYQPIQEGRVAELVDESYGMTRTEVRCARCQGHLGHIFSDGPEPTGLRYCINAAALDFRPVE